MNAKGLLYFLFGGALGAGLTFLILKEKYKNEAEEAIEDVKAYYKKLEEENKETASIKAEDVGAEKETTAKNAYESITAIYAGGKDTHINYSDISEEDLKEDEDEEDDDDEAYAGIYPEEPVGHPYVIDEAAFVNEKSFYDKVGLFYYEGNNVVCNENYEPVADWQDLIGPDIGARFRLQDRSDEPFSYIYIRNDSLGSDYEIALKKESFE